mgnify:CR=1 FL=1
MPTYRFYNSKTKEEYTDLMTISEMEKFIKKKHIKLLPTFDWDGALRPLDNIYYNKPESKDKGGQTHEQD